jgi:hypothetical protein
MQPQRHKETKQDAKKKELAVIGTNGREQDLSI